MNQPSLAVDHSMQDLTLTERCSDVDEEEDVVMKNECDNQIVVPPKPEITTSTVK